MENERKITAMGMAAGQARLLSITARMSDNELRAQIINNNKMRLATESSQVSDHYVQALNEAELMFTNYDADNNASFKQLTFNSLTAYNPYNNQYALTNASGNILLSETDYKNYEKTKDKGLDEFLKCYGLEKTTTFFDKDNLSMYIDPATGLATNYVAFTNPYVEDDISTSNINETTNQSTGFTPEELFLAYLGNDDYKKLKGLTDDQKITMRNGVDVIPNGYETTLNSVLYNDYFRYLDKYNQKYEEFMKSISTIMQRTYDQEILKRYGYDDTEAILKAINKASSTNDMKNIMENLQKIIDFRNYDGDSMFNGASQPPFVITNPASTANDIQNFYETLNNLLKGNKDDNITHNYTVDASTSPVTFNNYEMEFDPATGNITSVKVKDDDGNDIGASITISGTNASGNYTETKTDGNGNTINQQTNIKITYNSTNKEYEVEEILVGANTLDNMKDVAKSVVRSIKNSIPNCWDPFAGDDKNNPQGTGVFTSQEPAKTYLKEYKEAYDELKKVIYGDPPSGAVPGILDIGDAYVLYNAIGQQWKNPVDGKDYGPYGNFDEDFYQVYLNIILDKVQDTYGEPYFTWIDTSSPNASYNENGEAKAKWYENIWNMCEKNGYRVLKDGLASSTEWIQYAFESGIVNMQQVDTNGYWNPLIYTNCSDITSQTSDKKIAQAEAEYNAAMNKIENKDKRYDLELKNIDTEHNSLQTEYESIKSAIDKHVERVFKLYS